MIAQRIRDFFEVLFGSRRIAELKESLAKAEKTADYFRARADRLELMLLRPAQPRTERKEPTPLSASPMNANFAGTGFGKLYAERVKKIRDEEEAERKNQAATVKGAN